MIFLTLLSNWNETKVLLLHKVYKHKKEPIRRKDITFFNYGIFCTSWSRNPQFKFITPTQITPSLTLLQDEQHGKKYVLFIFNCDTMKRNQSDLIFLQSQSNWPYVIVGREHWRLTPSIGFAFPFTWDVNQRTELLQHFTVTDEPYQKIISKSIFHKSVWILRDLRC